MENTTQYVVLFLISVVLTAAVGRVLYSSGEPFLAEVFGDEGVAASINRLLAVLFQLLTVGVLAVISTMDLQVQGAIQTSVTKLGVVLLVVGGAHAVAMRVLLHARARRRAAQPFPPLQAYYPGPQNPAPYDPPCAPAPYPLAAAGPGLVG